MRNRGPRPRPFAAALRSLSPGGVGLLLAGLALLLQPVHYLVTPHRVCQQHHDLEHGRPGPVDPHPSAAPSGGVRVAPRGPVPAIHTPCENPGIEHRGPVPLSPATLRTAGPPPRSVPRVGADVRVAAVPLYLLAPKQSPPRV